MKLVGYFDESGTNLDAAYLTVAGYMSPEYRWNAFELEWKTALEQLGLAFFHMTDCANGAPPYDHWSKEERWSMQQRMFSILNRHALCGMGVAISMASYRRIVSPVADAKFPGPYGLAVRLTIDAGANTAAFLGVDMDPWIDYRFESGVVGSGKIAQAVARLGTQLRDLRVESVEFQRKDQLTPLQTGDIAAYELMRYVNTKFGIDTRYPPRKFNLESLGESVPTYWGAVKDEVIYKWSEMACEAAFV